MAEGLFYRILIFLFIAKLKVQNVFITSRTLYLMRFVLILFLLTALQLSASAQQALLLNELELRSDNDAYLGVGQDRYYTNGLFINWRHALRSKGDSARLKKRILELSLGQELYNAHTGSVDHYSELDRAITGYLYVGASYQWFGAQQQRSALELQIGTIGPRAGGREAQELIHNIVGFYEPEGWNYQLDNSYEVNLRYDYSRVMTATCKNFDLIFDGQASLGTTHSRINAGVVFRAGRFNRIDESSYFKSRVGRSTTAAPDEFYFYTRPSVIFTAYDATLQGGLFNKHQSSLVTFKPIPLAYEQELGVRYDTRRWSFNYAITIRSKEVKKQEYSHHQYGRLSLGFRF